METSLYGRSTDWRERRRLRAWELHQQGWKQCDIAAKLDVTCGAVSQWIKAAAEHGPQALMKRPAPGRPPRLTPEQKAAIPGKLSLGAEAYGFAGDVWTCERIARVILKEFGVEYHPDYIGPLLRSLNWSVQRPIVRAAQRDEAAIQNFQDHRLPELKKKQRTKDTRSSS
jgi:transposase